MLTVCRSYETSEPGRPTPSTARASTPARMADASRVAGATRWSTASAMRARKGSQTMAGEQGSQTLRPISLRRLSKIPWLKLSGTFPMGLGIPPLRIKSMLESKPLKSRILARRLAVAFCLVSPISQIGRWFARQQNNPNEIVFPGLRSSAHRTRRWSHVSRGS